MMNALLKQILGLTSIATGVTAITLASMTSAQAADFSFRGTFADDDDVQLFDFTVGTTSDVTLKTLSYAGGTQADNTVIAPGGFDPILALFDGNGDFIGSNDDGSFPDVGIDPVTGEEYDTFLELNLTPGDYTVAVSQFDNFFDDSSSNNLSSGFVREGEPTFTAGLGFCSNGQFCDVTGDNRTNEWAFDVLNVDTATVMEPPTAENTPESSTLLGLGSLFVLGFSTIKKRSHR